MLVETIDDLIAWLREHAEGARMNREKSHAEGRAHDAEYNACSLALSHAEDLRDAIAACKEKPNAD